jgi:hypothetical protein
MGEKDYFALHYPGKTSQEALVEDAKKLKDDFEILVKANPHSGFEQTVDPYNIIQKIIEKKDLVDDAERANYGYIRSFINQSFILYASPESEISSFHKARDVATEFPEELKLQNKIGIKLRDPIALASERRKALAFCEFSFLQGLVEAPTDEMLTHFEKVESRARSLIQRKIFSFFSQQSQHTLDAQMKLYQFNLPMNKAAFRNNAEKVLDLYKNGTEDAEKFIKYLNLEYFLKNPNAVKLNYDGIIDFCQGFLPGTSDYAPTLSVKGNISSVSARFPIEGKGTLLHEFGHVVSNILKGSGISQHSRSVYENAKACLAKKHPIEEKYQQNENHLVEEDWADTVAALASEENDGNPFCLIFSSSDTSLVLKKTDLNRIKDDHSGGLFRLLHFETIRKGSVPRACRGIIKSVNQKYDFSPCLK